MTDTKQLGAEGQDGLGRLYRQYAPWLGRRLRGKIGADAAADVVQETYIRAAPYILSDIRHPKAFLLRIAMNLLSDERRRDARQQRHRETAPQPVSEAATQFDALLLNEIIHAMPPLYRNVFVLNRFGGKGCRHAKGAPETLPVGETGVARARADRPEGTPHLFQVENVRCRYRSLLSPIRLRAGLSCERKRAA